MVIFSDTLRVLYVDDDGDIRQVVALALSLDPSIELRAYGSGQTALTALEEDGWRPDLAMLDVMMPEMDGLELARALRGKQGMGPMRLAFITARSRERDIAALLAAGADAVILKPFDPLTLADEVHRAAGGE